MRSDPKSWKTGSRCAADRPNCVAVAGDLGALRDTKTGDVIGEVNVAALVRHVKAQH